MTEIIQYVAGFSESEARLRHEAGMSKESPQEAEQDAIDRNSKDRCEPQCNYTVWRVRTTFEQM